MINEFHETRKIFLDREKAVQLAKLVGLSTNELDGCTKLEDLKLYTRFNHKLVAKVLFSREWESATVESYERLSERIKSQIREYLNLLNTSYSINITLKLISYVK